MLLDFRGINGLIKRLPGDSVQRSRVIKCANTAIDAYGDNQDNVEKARKILKQEFRDEVAIIGKTMGPWTLAYHVFGVETFLLMSIDDPGLTIECLNKYPIHQMKSFLHVKIFLPYQLFL